MGRCKVGGLQDVALQVPEGSVRLQWIRLPVTWRVTVLTELSTLKEWDDIRSSSLSTWRRVTCLWKKYFFFHPHCPWNAHAITFLRHVNNLKCSIPIIASLASPVAWFVPSAYGPSHCRYTSDRNVDNSIKGPCCSTLLAAVLSSTMVETLWMSELVVNTVRPPDTEDREEYREKRSGDRGSERLFLLFPRPFIVWLGSSVRRKVTCVKRPRTGLMVHTFSVHSKQLKKKKHAIRINYSQLLE